MDFILTPPVSLKRVKTIFNNYTLLYGFLEFFHMSNLVVGLGHLFHQLSLTPDDVVFSHILTVCLFYMNHVE